MQGFYKSTSDPCFYLNSKLGEVIYFHVNDLILVGRSENFATNFLKRSSNSACHSLNTIVDMLMELEGDKIHLSQPKHIDLGLEEVGLTDCKNNNSSLTQNQHLEPASNEDHAEFSQLNIKYQSAIGLLNHLSQYTQPNIFFAVSSLAIGFNAKPGMTHWKEVRKVWKYLKTTRNLKLMLEYKPSKEIISGYSDTTWGDKPTLCKSQMGYIIFHYGSLVLWNSSRQRNIN